MSADELTPKPIRPKDLKYQEGAHGHRRPRPMSAHKRRFAVSYSNKNVRQDRPLVEVIFFGKVHYVTIEEFHKNAEKYATILGEERRLLLGQAMHLKEVYEADLKEPWYVRGVEGIQDSGSAASEAWNAKGGFLDKSRAFFKNVAEPMGRVEAKHFDEVIDHFKDIDDPKSLDLEVLHSIGVELHRGRAMIEELRRCVSVHRGRVQDAAQAGGQYAELVSDTAFQALHLVPRLTGMTPVQEVPYRLGIFSLEAGARATGAGIAGTGSSGALRELGAVARVRIPQMLVDLIAPMMKSMGVAANAPGRQLTEYLLGEIVEITFWAINITVTGKKVDDKELRDFVAARLNRLLGTLVSRALGQSADSPTVKKIVALSIENVIGTLGKESTAIYDIMQEEKRSALEVVLTRLPWMIANVLQGILLGFLGRHMTAESSTPSRPQSSPPPGPTAKDTLRILQNRKVVYVKSAVYTPSKGVRLGTLSAVDYQKQWRLTRFPRLLANHFRRRADELGHIIWIRRPGEGLIKFFGNVGRWMKPHAVLAKTAKSGPHAGLVVRPSRVPPTHDDFDKAQAHWEQSMSTMKAAGMMVRDDGVVFHPDMVREAAVAAGLSKGRGDEIADTVVRASSAGHFDLDHPNARAWLVAELGQLRATALLSDLRRVQIGLYSDLDSADHLDAKSGRGLTLGSGDEVPGTERYTLMSKRLGAFNEKYNPLAHWKKGPGYDPLQHGEHLAARNPDGSLKYGEAGELVGIFPGGKVVVIHAAESPETNARLAELGLERPNRLANESAADFARRQDAFFQRWMEAENKSYLGAKYRTPAERRSLSNDPAIDQHQPLSEKQAETQARSEDHARTAARGPRRTRTLSKKITDLPRVKDDQIKEAARSTVSKIGLRSLEASLLSEGLILLRADNVAAFEKLWSGAELTSVIKKARELKVTIGIDEGAKNLVVITSTGRTPGRGVARLAQAAKTLKLADLGVQLFFWLVYAGEPITEHHVAGKLGGKDPGVSAADRSALADVLSAAKWPAGQALFAFRTIRSHTTYSRSGDPDKAVVAHALDEVWVRVSTQTLEFATTQISGQPIALFLAAPLGMPDDSAEVTRLPAPARSFDLDQVSGWQAALKMLGFEDLEIDGRADGEPTLEAVCAFQNDTGYLRVDGIVGPKTKKALAEALDEQAADYAE